MKRSELVYRIAELSGLRKGDAERALNAMLEAITLEMSSGGDVQLTGFGTFEVHNRGARTTRNPRTGESVNVAAAKVPFFRPGKTLKEKVR
jgi:DNA-binding protein HU-beta